MRRILLALPICFGLVVPATADYEAGHRAFMAGDFATAYAELLPVAEAGDANAQEMIGVLYALGLAGLPQDRRAAFDWYMLASEQGHAGAQSGVGWYYEVGLGGVPVDLVTAHAWYTLSTIGGDPDAAISLEEIEKEMTGEQIAAAQAVAAALLAE